MRFFRIPGWRSVKADPGQIEQVILNLALNARDAMPNGGKLTVMTLNVAMTQDEAIQRPPMTSGDYVLLSVTDTGHGMDEATKIISSSLFHNQSRWQRYRPRLGHRLRRR